MASEYMTTYPRPDFERPSPKWQSLCGKWDFAFDDEDKGLNDKWQLRGIPSTSLKTITVPFAFQTPSSGINEQAVHEVLWYSRLFMDPRSNPKTERLLVRFGAVDYEATVWVNGRLVGSHRGGHVPFDVDVTDVVDGTTGGEHQHQLTLRVYDSATDLTQPRGKQYWGPEPESIFYTPTSGIWLPVWMESVPVTRIGDGSAGTVLVTNDLKSGELHATIAVLRRPAGQAFSVEVEAEIGGVKVGSNKAELKKDKDFGEVTLGLRLDANKQTKLHADLLHSAPLDNTDAWRNGLAIWSPDHPLLYDLVLRLYDVAGKTIDEVKTQTGVRSLDWTRGDRTFRLNNKPLFQTLCLDQGYWPSTGLTPPNQDALKLDIELSKKVGFNGCRKHQKVEDPLFLYWADRLGYLVWGEMANAYTFDQEYCERFDQEWREAVKRDINHACVVAWTPVNESWAYTDLRNDVRQRQHIRQLYYMTKILDPTRPVNDNCGWESVLTDLTTFHDYNDADELQKTCATMGGILADKAGRPMFVPPVQDGHRLLDARAEINTGAPVLCTEFGGVNIAPGKSGQGEGEKGNDKDWGYTTASDPEDLLARIERLAMAVVGGGHCCGVVYTQLTDIEQEVNGLYSFDRREKIDATRVKAIFNKSARVYYEKLEEAFGDAGVNGKGEKESVSLTDSVSVPR